MKLERTTNDIGATALSVNGRISGIAMISCSLLPCGSNLRALLVDGFRKPGDGRAPQHFGVQA